MIPNREERPAGDASDGGEGLGGSPGRIEGFAKVTGAATYALDHVPDRLAHAVLLPSTIGAGRVLSIDVDEARAMPGVLMVMTPDTVAPLRVATDPLGGPPRPFSPLRHAVLHQGQAIAAVVAETREQAADAVGRLRVRFEQQPVLPDFDAEAAGAGEPVARADLAWGDADAALLTADVAISASYETPREYNQPLEPHGVVAEWHDGRLTIHEPSQWVDGMARSYAEWFGLDFGDVRLVSAYIGGGFGSKVMAMAHGAIAAIAARELRRPVKLALTRTQTFTAFGGRPATRQDLRLGATSDGLLVAIAQDGANETAIDGVRLEQLNSATSVLYGVANFRSSQSVVRVNTVLPGALRAPGKNPSAFGVECAMDELAYTLPIDPLELRLRNQPSVNPATGEPWSSRRLDEALTAGAAAFGWNRRPMAPRSMRDGEKLVGWGLATGCFPARHTPAEAMVRLLADGTAEVLSSAVDMGTGTYTVLAQTAAEVLGLPVQRVRVRLGDSALPRAPLAGNSQIASLMAAAVHKTAIAARDQAIALAHGTPGSPFFGSDANRLELSGGEVLRPLMPETAVPIGDLLRAAGMERIEVLGNTFPDGVTQSEQFDSHTTLSGMKPPDNGGHSVYSWGAHFIEVKVDEAFGTVRVSRVVSAFDCGRLYNPKLARSQWEGGIIMGIGQALLEGGSIDQRQGRMINDNLGDYLIATNADIPEIQTISVGQPDELASPMGGKPVGEIGIVGVAPAIVNAVFHATGRRFRKLPLNIATMLD